MTTPRATLARPMVFFFLLTGCLAPKGSPTLQEAPTAALRPCYVPRVDQFYFERDWLKIKGRELEAFKLANAYWWMGEASWNETFDPREVYGAEQQIFGTLSRASGASNSREEQQVRLLYLEEREEPMAPVLLGLKVGPQRAFFYVKTLSRGKSRSPGGAGCWGDPLIPEQRYLTVAQAKPAADCALALVDERIKSEPWKVLPDEGRDAQYLVEYQDASHHGLAQLDLQVSNIDGVDRDKLRQCLRLMASLARKGPGIPEPLGGRLFSVCEGPSRSSLFGG